MSFETASGMVERYIERFDDIRNRAIKSLPRSKSTPFNSMYELFTKVHSLLKTLAHLERFVEQGRGYRRICGNGLLISTDGGSTFMKFKPLRVVSYSAVSNSVKLTLENVGVEISGSNITITIGKLSRSLPYLNSDDMANNAAIYSTLLGKVIYLPDELARAVVSCAKAMGVKV